MINRILKLPLSHTHLCYLQDAKHCGKQSGYTRTQHVCEVSTALIVRNVSFKERVQRLMMVVFLNMELQAASVRPEEKQA